MLQLEAQEQGYAGAATLSKGWTVFQACTCMYTVHWSCDLCDLHLYCLSVQIERCCRLSQTAAMATPAASPSPRKAKNSKTSSSDFFADMPPLDVLSLGLNFEGVSPTCSAPSLSVLPDTDLCACRILHSTRACFMISTWLTSRSPTAGRC